MTLPTTEAPTLPRTLDELRERLATLSIDVDQVQSIHLEVAVPDGQLLVRVTTYALDPLGQRFLLLDEHGVGPAATEERLLPLAAVFG